MVQSLHTCSAVQHRIAGKGIWTADCALNAFGSQQPASDSLWRSALSMICSAGLLKHDLLLACGSVVHSSCFGELPFDLVELLCGL
jgi:hypothetical protein